MKTIKYDPNVITQEMIARRAREICVRGCSKNSYPIINKMLADLESELTYLAIEELKDEFNICSEEDEVIDDISKNPLIEETT